MKDDVIIRDFQCLGAIVPQYPANSSVIFPQYLLTPAISPAIFTVFTCNFFRDISVISLQVLGGQDVGLLPCTARSYAVALCATSRHSLTA